MRARRFAFVLLMVAFGLAVRAQASEAPLCPRRRWRSAPSARGSIRPVRSPWKAKAGRRWAARSSLAGSRDRADVGERAARLRRSRPLSRHRRRRDGGVRRGRGRLPAAKDDRGPQHVAAGHREGDDSGSPASRPRRWRGRRRDRQHRRRAAGRRSAARRRPASPTASTCPTPGARRPARTSAGARRFPASRTRARSSGAIAVFVTSAVSSDPKATFRPGLYGDGDASDGSLGASLDALRARQARPGKIVWERVAFAGRAAREAPHQVDLRQRHAGHRRPHRRRLVRIAGRLRLRRRRASCSGRSISGRLDIGAYDIPTYEWGTASSPIIWNGLVILQCDTQADSFLLALDAETGEDGVEDRSRRAAVVGHADGRDHARRARSSSPTRRTSSAATIRGPARSCGGSAAARRSPRRRRSSPTICSSSRAAARRSGRSSWSRPGARGDLTLARRPDRRATAIVWSKTGPRLLHADAARLPGHPLRARQQRRASTPTI